MVDQAVGGGGCAGESAGGDDRGASLLDLLEEYEKVNERFAEEMSSDEMEKLLERQGELQEKIEMEIAARIRGRLLELAAHKRG